MSVCPNPNGPPSNFIVRTARAPSPILWYAAIAGRSSAAFAVPRWSASMNWGSAELPALHLIAWGHLKQVGAGLHAADVGELQGFMPGARIGMGPFHRSFELV